MQTDSVEGNVVKAASKAATAAAPKAASKAAPHRLILTPTEANGRFEEK